MEGKILFSDVGRILYSKRVTLLPFVKGGAFGNIYRLDDDKVVKLLRAPSTTHQYDVMKKIKGLNLPNYYRLYEILSSKLFFNKSYIGNIASYHKPSDVDVLEMPSDWLIENYEGLMEAATKLGEANIKIVDARPANAIINDSGITIIDVDLYEMASEQCVVKNICHMQTELLLKLLKENCLTHHSDVWSSDMFSKVVNQLVINPDTNQFAKKLSRYPKPIDYINDRIQR